MLARCSSAPGCRVGYASVVAGATCLSKVDRPTEGRRPSPTPLSHSAGGELPTAMHKAWDRYTNAKLHIHRHKHARVAAEAETHQLRASYVCHVCTTWRAAESEYWRLCEMTPLLSRVAEGLCSTCSHSWDIGNDRKTNGLHTAGQSWMRS